MNPEKVMTMETEGSVEGSGVRIEGGGFGSSLTGFWDARLWRSGTPPKRKTQPTNPKASIPATLSPNVKLKPKALSPNRPNLT